MKPNIDFKLDCRHFSGQEPCLPHKAKGATCPSCLEYSPVSKRILIIKTVAAGDVIRSTPILRKLREMDPEAEITWLTDYPDLVPSPAVDRILKFDWTSSLRLMAENFDVLINLDKAKSECSLASQIKAKSRFGFSISDSGKVLPLNDLAVAKWTTGVDDLAMKANGKHYIQELFEICGLEFSGEEYWMNPLPACPLNLDPSLKWVGLNTGSGDRWVTRRWPEEHYIRLARLLRLAGYGVLLLGGEQEQKFNHKVAYQSGAINAGVWPLLEFAAIINNIDVLVTGVTMALHMALAQKTPVLLLNNIFPTQEFHLYGRGMILEPELSCQACYKPVHDERCQVQNCLSRIQPETVLSAIESNFQPKSLKRPAESFTSQIDTAP